MRGLSAAKAEPPLQLRLASKLASLRIRSPPGRGKKAHFAIAGRQSPSTNERVAPSLPAMDDSPEMNGEEAEHEAPSAAELEEAGQESMFGAPAPAAPAPAPPPPPVVKAAPAQPYRVLARKYRSQTFAELIGQDAMVQTLANAIKRDRLAHAFLMTGIRGVGKTSTARLIAKALNCEGPDGKGGPTIDPCGVCDPCVAISEGRHIDVIEMDAASNTKVEQMRELLDGVMYATVSARYKIYIIDEVHMLSNSSFNAMLKTLEEPPAHVKFIFATTEVEKLPVTVWNSSFATTSSTASPAAIASGLPP